MENASTWIRFDEGPNDVLVTDRTVLKETDTERYESWSYHGATTLVMVRDGQRFVMRHSRASFDRITVPTWIEPESLESIAANARAIESFSRIPMPSDAVRRLESQLDNERDRRDQAHF